MKNKLYIVYPFSSSENYVRKFIDSEAYFLTTKRLCLECRDIEFVEALCNVIDSCEIKEIVLVGNEDCRFANMILQEDIDPLLFKEKILLDIYLDNYAVIKQIDPKDQRRLIIAETLFRIEEELCSNGLITEKIKNESIMVSKLFISQLDNEKLMNETGSNFIKQH